MMEEPTGPAPSNALFTTPVVLSLITIVCAVPMLLFGISNADGFLGEVILTFAATPPVVGGSFVVAALTVETRRPRLSLWLSVAGFLSVIVPLAFYMSLFGADLI